MIIRVWRGWAKQENVEQLEVLWTSEILPSIKNKRLPGFINMELVKRDLGSEVEFMTFIRFESLEGIKSFAGTNHEEAVVPKILQKLLSKWDLKCEHFSHVTKI